ncbi:MAG: HGGxSTG domain-containing protein [Planctomycetaceae bacterium]
MRARPYEGLLPADAIDLVDAERTPKRLRPTCGARTRSGRPCSATPVWDDELDRPRNGRCRLHGGLSTGPTSAQGRQRIAAAAALRIRRRREALRASNDDAPREGRT